MAWSYSDLVEAAGVALSIVLIVFLIRKKWKMYAALFLATLVLFITNGNTVEKNLTLIFTSLTSPTAFELTSMVIAVTLLGSFHHQIGGMEKMVKSLRVLIRDTRILLMVLPATISLLCTVPGGAVLSAPMVAETGKDMKMGPQELAMSNLIFRHLAAPVNPFNPGLIMAAGITGISVFSFIRFTLPVIIVLALLVLAWMLRRYPAENIVPASGPGRKGVREALADLLVSASPYLVALFLGVACGVYFPLSMLAGIGAAFLIYLPREGKGSALKSRLGMLARSMNWPVFWATIGIVLYKDFMSEADTFFRLVDYLVEHGFPLLLLLVVFSFITGFISGHNATSMGIALPVLLPLLEPGMLSVKYAGLIYLCSFAGYLSSPVHLCTYLTVEYFRAPMYTVLKKINAFSVLLMAAGLFSSLLY